MCNKIAVERRTRKKWPTSRQIENIDKEKPAAERGNAENNNYWPSREAFIIYKLFTSLSRAQNNNSALAFLLFVLYREERKKIANSELQEGWKLFCRRSFATIPLSSVLLFFKYQLHSFKMFSFSFYKLCWISRSLLTPLFACTAHGLEIRSQRKKIFPRGGRFVTCPLWWYTQ